jgi:hypothetical protein
MFLSVLKEVKESVDAPGMEKNNMFFTGAITHFFVTHMVNSPITAVLHLAARWLPIP